MSSGELRDPAPAVERSSVVGSPVPPEDRRLLWGMLGPYLLLNLPLMFLFVDLGNLNDNIYSGGLMALGLNPYRFGSAQVAGYSAMPFTSLSYVAYFGWGFDPFRAFLIPKLLLVGATYATGVLLFRIARSEGFPRPRLVFFGMILNPFVIVVNSVWGETDAFVILALVAGFALLRYGWRDPPDYPAVALGVVAILWTVFGYYSPVVLVPAFIAYAGARRARMTTLALFLVVGTMLAIPVLLLGLGSSAPSMLVQGMQRTDPFSVANLFVPASQTIPPSVVDGALATAVLLGIALPLALRQRVPAAVSMFLVFSVVILLTFSYVQGDNPVLFVPLLLLSVLFLPREQWTYAKLILLQLFLVPEFLIVQMFNGSGGVAGFSYWGYPEFHSRFSYFDLFGGAVGWKVLLGLYLAGLVGTNAYLILRSLRRLPSTGPAEPALNERRPNPFRSGFAPHAGRTTVIALGVTAAIALASLPLAASGAGGATISSDRVLPAYLFPAVDPLVYGVALPSPSTYTVSPSRGALSVASTDHAVAFVANVEALRYSLSFNVSVANPRDLPLGDPLTLLQVDSLNVTFLRQLDVPANTTPTVPRSTGGAPTVAGSDGALSNVSRLYSLNGSQRLDVGLGMAQLEGGGFVAGELPLGPPTVPRSLWQVFTPACSVTAYFTSGALELVSSRGGNPSYSLPTSWVGGEWVVTGFRVSPDGLSLTGFADGRSQTVAFCLAQGGPAAVRIGTVTNDAGGVSPYVLEGWATDLFPSPAAGYPSRVVAIVQDANRPSPLAETAASALSIALAGSPDGASLTSAGQRIGIPGPTTYFVFGKLTDAPAALDFTFSQISLVRANSSFNPTPVILDFAVVVPLWLVAWFFSPRLGHRFARSSAKELGAESGPKEPPREPEKV